MLESLHEDLGMTCFRPWFLRRVFPLQLSPCFPGRKRFLCSVPREDPASEELTQGCVSNRKCWKRGHLEGAPLEPVSGGCWRPEGSGSLGTGGFLRGVRKQEEGEEASEDQV